MAPQELIIVHRSEGLEKIFHAKGVLHPTVNGKLDESFKRLVASLHPGISRTLAHDKCAVTVKLHTAFEDEWRVIEKLIFRAISEQLDWTDSVVTIRRRRTWPKGKKVVWPWLSQLRREKFHADFDHELKALLSDEEHRAHKTADTKPPTTT